MSMMRRVSREMLISSLYDSEMIDIAKKQRNRIEARKQLNMKRAYF